MTSATVLFHEGPDCSEMGDVALKDVDRMDSSSTMANCFRLSASAILLVSREMRSTVGGSAWGEIMTTCVLLAVVVVVDVSTVCGV